MIELFETRITAKAKALVNEVLDSGMLNQGIMVDRLEAELSCLGYRHPVTLNSCTSSLHLALILSDVKQDDEVILPAQTFIATGLAVLMVGAKPVFADILPSGNIDPEDIVKKITPRTKCVMVVHWGGSKADMFEINKIALTHDLKVIEDAAHAFGLGDSVGGCIQSDFCCFSLQAIKTVTAGDGGILCCRDEEDYKRAIRLRWFGMDKKHVVRNAVGERVANVSELGMKYHMNDLNASLALGNLDGLQDVLERRRIIAEKYISAFSRLSTEFIRVPPRSVSTNWLFTILADRRDELILHLKRNFIQSGKVDGRIDSNDIFADYRSDLPEQDWFEHRQVSIPCTSKMSDEDVQRVINCVEDFYE